MRERVEDRRVIRNGATGHVDTFPFDSRAERMYMKIITAVLQSLSRLATRTSLYLHTHAPGAAIGI